MSNSSQMPVKVIRSAKRKRTVAARLNAGVFGGVSRLDESTH